MRTTAPDDSSPVSSADPPGSRVARRSRAARAEQGRTGRAGADRGRRSFLTELPFLVIAAFVLALVLKTFLVQAFFIPSESMLPTLQIDDRVLVNKLVYDLREPERGEIVVFREEAAVAPPTVGWWERVTEVLASGLGAPSGEQDLIKRVIGLPGETLEIRDDVLFIDGAPLPEALEDNGGYLGSVGPDDFGPVEVPEDAYYVLGDNRANSADSRFGLGPIERDDILGRAFVTIWPLDRLGLLQRPQYDVPEAAAEVEAGR